ncbi:uncharacterized protein LOC120781073 [Bactrocera tryoni]|uniref:uncharacterized protein LOC120781073 n=1 Tax=Bactrocera tryoni TaxID=59916 RepID=UPI001A970708|nr:uncharacterized protein LOC120781073 [Bactrocera tryoni]
MKGSTGDIGKGALARKLKTDHRLAAKKWNATEVLSESETDGSRLEAKRHKPAVKRQRSHEAETSLGKKPRRGASPTFSEIAKGAGAKLPGVVDRSREDGAISHEEWKRVAAAISSVFLKVVKKTRGHPPKYTSAGWHHGLHKLTRCADERSGILYKKTVSLVGEVWKGARLEAVDKEDLPLRHRARVWLPAEPSTPKEIEEIVRYCNPSLPAHDWRVIRLERTDEPYRQALIMLNAESKTKGAISYGLEMVVLKVLPTDARADGTQAADAGEKGEGVSDA